MATTAPVPSSRARGRFFRGSRTSPLTNDTSAQPSYAQSTETRAKPNSPASSVLPAAGVTPAKWPKSPCPTAKATTTRRTSAPYLAVVVRFRMRALHRTPT